MLTVGVQSEEDKFPGLDHGDPAKESLLELFTAPSEFSSVTLPRLLEADIDDNDILPVTKDFQSERGPTNSPRKRRANTVSNERSG
jgi:hypothetical protein